MRAIWLLALAVAVSHSRADIAWCNNSNCEDGFKIERSSCGLGRRVSKAISNSANWNGTYRYYYSGQSVVEERNSSDKTLRQYVWGTQYTDEIVQIGINDDPGDTEQNCETFYYAMQDANYNVLGIVNSSGDLKERYEYTPYGQRTVYKSAGGNDLMVMSPLMDSQQAVSSTFADFPG